MHAPRQRIKSASPALFKRQPDTAHRPPARTPPTPGLSLRRAVGNQAYGQMIQTKLTVNQPGDRFEREADRVADAVMRMPSVPEPVVTLTAAPGIHRACAACESGSGTCPECQEEGTLQRAPVTVTGSGLVQRQEEPEEEEEMLQTKGLEAHGGPEVVRRQAVCSPEEEELLQKKPGSAGSALLDEKTRTRIQALRGRGEALPEPSRRFMERRFGRDFSSVRVHRDSAAASTAAAVRARAFTLGRDVVFGHGQYSPDSVSGRRLLAHELTHVVQQGAAPVARKAGAGEKIAVPGSGRIQRKTTTLQGGPGKVTKRQLFDFRGPTLDLPPSKTPGGSKIKGTAGTHQNCAGASLCGRREYINWPHLGIESSDGKKYPGVTASWSQATSFVPTGCKRVSCSGITVQATRCNHDEREIIAFLYRWPRGTATIKSGPDKGKKITLFQSDYHMIGRDVSILPTAWESKMDRREAVEDIRDPLQSLHDAYPHTMKKNRVVQKLCFCCDCKNVVTK